MITLYTWTTPNGRKASVMLEEIGAEYAVKPVNIGQDEQFDPAFLALSPNNKIPAIVDPDGEGGERVVFETGAILTYLAERSGRFLAPSAPIRKATRSIPAPARRFRNLEQPQTWDDHGRTEIQHRRRDGRHEQLDRPPSADASGPHQP